jgi:ribosome hibernation promoting factor
VRVEYTGRHLDVPDGVRRLGDRKLRKLSRLLPAITDVRVILSTDRHRQVVEVSVHSRHLDLTATEASGDHALSLSTAMDKLIRQAEKRVAKRRVRKGGARAGTLALPVAVASAPPEDGGVRVIRSRRFVVKPMTVEEAAIEVGASPDGVLVFRDAATERVNVLYKRKDGNLGLIEPEA